MREGRENEKGSERASERERERERDREREREQERNGGREGESLGWESEKRIKCHTCIQNGALLKWRSNFWRSIKMAL